MTRLNKETEQLIIEEYKNGKTMAEIGKQEHISPTTVMRVLNRNNIQTRSQGGIDKIDEEYVIKEYKKGKSSSEISKMFGVTAHTITNILEKHNIKRNNIYHNLDLVEDYWTVIDSYDKAYFLGFLITDGNVIGNAVRLSIKSNDVEILETFSKYTKNSNKICFDKRGCSTFSVKRKKWVSDLSQYGMMPNKTHKTYLPKLDEEYMPHLIRGMIDGDGWISYKSHQLGFCGTEQCVAQIRDYLSEKLNVYKVKILQTGPHLWQITWASIKDIEKIGKFLYENKKDCYLKRKLENFNKIIHVNTEVI